jgi:hypothetical protein
VVGTKKLKLNKMKKIFTLFAGLLMAAAVFAADRRPVVTLNSSRNYKIVIDGRSYFGGSQAVALDNFVGNRMHTIKVYEMKRGGFFSRERMIDASTFQLGRNDVMISIDFRGQISIREMNSGYPRRDGWNGRDDDNGWNSGKVDSHDSHDSRDSRNGRGRGF